MLDKLFPDPFLKNQNWSCLWINSLVLYTVCFYSLLSCGLWKDIETKLQTTCFSHIYRVFKKTKRSLELASLPHFLHDFWRKIFLLLYSINGPNFIVWLPLLRGILGNLHTVIVCWSGSDVINFETNVIFLIKLFFLHDQKVKIKIQISWTRKELLRRNKKPFSSHFKGFHWSK